MRLTTLPSQDEPEHQDEHHELQEHIQKRRSGKILVNTFLFIGILFFALDATPTTLKLFGYLPFQSLQPLRARIEPLLDLCGLWQGPWHLFSPEPYKERVRFSADVWIGEDEHVGEWQSPKWKDLSVSERLALRRFMRFLRILTSEFPSNPERPNKSENPEWEAFAQYIARTQLPFDLDSTALEEKILVEIYYHQQNVLPPPPMKEMTSHDDDGSWFGMNFPKLTNGFWKSLGPPIETRLSTESERLIYSWRR